MSSLFSTSKEPSTLGNVSEALSKRRNIILTIPPFIIIGLLLAALFGGWAGYGTLLNLSHHIPLETLRNHTQHAISRPCDGCEQLPAQSIASMATHLKELTQPIVPPALTKDDGEEPDMDAKKQVMGKKFCIADIDTRRYDSEGQILSNTFNWDDTDTLSAGMLNHYIYASIHGYSYHMIRSQPWPGNDRDNVWSRLPRMLELLDSCPLLLVLDCDVVFQQLELPFDHLLNRWNITNDTALAMPWDTAGFVVAGKPHGHQRPNNDEKGKLNMNAGVIVAQDLPRTREIIKAWIRCPDEIEGCDKYRHGWPAEQGAFNNHIRYLYQASNDLATIPCNDANGYPEQPSDCHGRYLRHFTTVKSDVKDNVAHVMLDTMAKVFAAHRSSSNSESNVR